MREKEESRMLLFNRNAFMIAALSPFLGQTLWANHIVGTTDGTNCIPFSCSVDHFVSTYQQVYSSSSFYGITAFNLISFSLGQGGTLDSGTYVIDFSYTPKAVDGLSDASPSANIGADETLFGSFVLPGGTAPSTLSFEGTTFDYDPTQGNLLMTIASDRPNPAMQRGIACRSPDVATTTPQPRPNLPDLAQR